MLDKILQGTTPSLEIKIDTDDFYVTDVVKLELTILQNGETTIYGLSDVDMNDEENTFTYHFTEAETLAMIPKETIYYQLRFMFSDDSILGTVPMPLVVVDLISEEVMTE